MNIGINGCLGLMFWLLLFCSCIYFAVFSLLFTYIARFALIRIICWPLCRDLFRNFRSCSYFCFIVLANRLVGLFNLVLILGLWMEFVCLDLLVVGLFPVICLLLKNCMVFCSLFDFLLILGGFLI
jgi:hypothetical protein